MKTNMIATPTQTHLISLITKEVKLGNRIIFINKKGHIGLEFAIHRVSAPCLTKIYSRTAPKTTPRNRERTNYYNRSGRSYFFIPSSFRLIFCRPFFFKPETVTSPISKALARFLARTPRGLENCLSANFSINSFRLLEVALAELEVALAERPDLIEIVALSFRVTATLSSGCLLEVCLETLDKKDNESVSSSFESSVIKLIAYINADFGSLKTFKLRFLPLSQIKTSIWES